MLRLFTFSGTHPHLSDGRRLTPEQIVDTLLDGVRRKDRLMLIRLVREFLRPYRLPLLAIVVLQFLSTVAMLYLPSLNADIIDHGVVTGDTGYILRRRRPDARWSHVGQILCSIAAV